MKPHELSPEDRKELLKYYGKDHTISGIAFLVISSHRLLHISLTDANGNGVLEDKEIAKIIDDYNNHKPMHESVYKMIRSYDIDKSGDLDEKEFQNLQKAFKSTDSSARYAAYTARIARLFRYLAFSSDFGEALRPVISPTVVNASYGIAGAYVIADVAWEAHKCKERGYRSEHGDPMTLTRCVVERSTFQALASVTIPFVLIHTSVDMTTRLCKRIGRFQKWGPSVVGLMAIPILPMYLDEPVEKAVESFFHNYGPWKKTDNNSTNDNDTSATTKVKSNLKLD